MRDLIHQMHGRGFHDEMMAARLKVSVSTISRIRSDLDLRPNPKPRDSMLKDADVRAMHAQGLVDQKIADAFGVSRELVQKRRQALKLPPNGWNKKP